MADLYKKDSKLDDYLPISTTSIYSPASTKALTAMIKMALDTDNPSIKKWLKKNCRKGIGKNITYIKK